MIILDFDLLVIIIFYNFPYFTYFFNFNKKKINIYFKADTSDIYKPTWSSIYHKIKKDQMQGDSSLQVIEVGETFSLTVSETGKMYSWGSNDYFQLGRNSLEDGEEESGHFFVPLENGIKPKKVEFY